MKGTLLISICVLLSLFVGALPAFANGSPTFPKQALIALYCPREAPESAQWSAPGLTFAGALPPRARAERSMRGNPSPASAPIRLGTVGALTSLNFQTRSALTPYLGAKFGLSDPANGRLIVPKKVLQEEKTNFLPYRLGFGLGCEVDKNLNLNLGYRFGLPTEFLFKDTLRNGLTPPEEGNEVSLRIRMNF